MANIGFNIAKAGLLGLTGGALDPETDTLKAILVMTNFSADQDDNTVSAFSALDEMDGSGFNWGHSQSGRKTLAVTTTVDDSSDRGDVNVDAGTTTWASLGAGTRSVAGVVICKEGSANDTTAVPYVFLEFASPVAANGEDFTVQWDAGSGDIFRIT